jgi:hypothetical protein
MNDLDYDKPKYYINPKERQLFLLHLYRERIIGEATVMYAFRYQRIKYSNKAKLDERVVPQLDAYDKKLGLAIEQADRLIEKLTAIINDLEQNV